LKIEQKLLFHLGFFHSRLALLSDDLESQAVPGLGRQWSLAVLWCNIVGSDCPVQAWVPQGWGGHSKESRLGQDCELLREVMVSWVRQILFSSDGNYAVAAKDWLAV
jgi:hypothetical protein